MNCIITGTGPLAFAGVTSVTCKFTLIAGYDELSTCPISRLVMVIPLSAVLATSHVTAGVIFGVLP